MSFGELVWPPPKEFLDAGDIRTFGYESMILLTTTITLSGSATDLPAVPLHADVTWLACRKICIPGSATPELTLTIRAEPSAPTVYAPLFEEARRATADPRT